jgi:hypothetical protein
MSISSVNSSNATAIANANNSQSQALKTLLASLESQPTLLDYLSDNGSGDANSSGDILDLSTAGQTAADQLYQLLEAEALDTLQAPADKASAAIQQKLSTALAQNGIDTSQEIDLQLDSSGKVVVTNDNPQKQQIEDAINNHPDLKKAVTQYLQFMQAIAPSLESSSSSQTASSELAPLLAALGGNAQGAVTLALQGNGFTASCRDANNNVVVLASSQPQ